jgi:tRNA-splicing endonuclease subunit Sen54
MPTLQELSDLFGVLPELPLPLPRQKRPANNAQEQSKPNEQAKAVPPAPSSTTTEQSFLRRLFPWAFPTTLQTTKGPKVNPFMALKSGKKMIIIAAVDSGNISFFKFSEGAFSEWPMA